MASLFDSLKKIGWLRSLRYLVADITKMMGYPHKKVLNEWEDAYRASPDPQNYALEAQRYQDSIDLVSLILPNGKLRSAVDVGCGEGFLTARLRSLAHQVLALDFVELSLERARTRLKDCDNVSFLRFDLLNDSFPGHFQLVTAVGVLECFQWPGDIRKAAAKLYEATEVGGYLLVGTTVRAEPVESSRWGRVLYRGTHLHKRLAETFGLEVIAKRRCACIRGEFEQILFRRTS
jgi:SAM-dependent methyltransferase